MVLKIFFNIYESPSIIISSYHLKDRIFSVHFEK